MVLSLLVNGKLVRYNRQQKISTLVVVGGGLVILRASCWLLAVEEMCCGFWLSVVVIMR